MESPEFELVRSTIRSAFAGVVLGNGVSVRQSEVIDRYGEGYSDQRFRALPGSEITDDWESVPDAELERACVAHLDAEGFRYYIPALALSVIRNYDAASIRVIGTISSLYPKAPNSVYTLRRYDLLNDSQKFALALFLDRLPKLVSLDVEDAACVSRAVRNYWFRFIEHPNGK
jgi:hypothetical protein